jgi:hypothetical protein
MLWDPVYLIIIVFRHLVPPLFAVLVATPTNVYLSMQISKEDVLNN